MLWIGVHLPALSLESFVATLAPEPPAGEPLVDDLDDLDLVGPVALIAQHRIVAANDAARACGVRPGQKRATALGLAPQLRLGESDPARASRPCRERVRARARRSRWPSTARPAAWARRPGAARGPAA